MLGKGEGSQLVGFGFARERGVGGIRMIGGGYRERERKGVGLTAKGAGEGGVRPVANVRCAVAEEVEVKEGEGELEGAEGEGVGDEWHVGVGGWVGRLVGCEGLWVVFLVVVGWLCSCCWFCGMVEWIGVR